MLVHRNSAGTVDESRRRRIEVTHVAEVHKKIFRFDGKGMHAAGFHADSRRPSPSCPVFGGNARARLGGNDFYTGRGAAASEIDHPAVTHISNAATVGREPPFRSLCGKSRRRA